jgi:hypothetical protein
MMKAFRGRSRRQKIAILLAIFLVAAQAAYAISEGTALGILAESKFERVVNAIGNWFLPTRSQLRRDQEIYTRELAEIAERSKANRKADADLGLPAIGEVVLGGAQVDSNVADLASGATGDLAFQFVDPRTGLPVMGPPVSFVLYEAINDVEPDSTLADYTVLGISEDPLSNFSLSFTAPPPVSLEVSTIGFESLIRATPFDSSGLPIRISGPEGENAAVGLLANVSPTNVVPEPSTWMLLVTGALGMTYRRLRRRRAA